MSELGMMYRMLAAVDNADTTDDCDKEVMLSGDLVQMGRMEQFLRGRGFDVRTRGVYPVIQGDTVEPALRALFEARVPGWRGQRHAFILHGICTEEEYAATIPKKVAN